MFSVLIKKDHEGKVHWGRSWYRDYQQPFGLGFYTRGGCGGSTYGEPGRNMSRSFSLVFGPWKLKLILAWKDLREEAHT